MAVEETKRDLFLKRAQVTIAILAGAATLILGIYNVKKTVFADKGPGTLSILVRSDKGASVPGARVEILTTEGVFLAASETSIDGKFFREGLDSGSYQIKINRVGFEPQFMTVQVKSKKTSDLEIILRSSASPSRIQSAFDEVSASWITKLGKSEPAKQDAAQ